MRGGTNKNKQQIDKLDNVNIYIIKIEINTIFRILT